MREFKPKTRREIELLLQQWRGTERSDVLSQWPQRSQFPFAWITVADVVDMDGNYPAFVYDYTTTDDSFADGSKDQLLREIDSDTLTVGKHYPAWCLDTDTDGKGIWYTKAGSGSGTPGRDPLFKYTYLTNTSSSDPGSGKLKFNNATLASATALYISETDGDSNALATWLATWDDSTSTVKGTIVIFKDQAAANFMVFNVTGTITDNGAWDTFTVAYVASGGSFADTDTIKLFFFPKADKGDTGATGSAGLPNQAQDEGVNLTVRSTLNFVGTRVRGADVASKTQINVNVETYDKSADFTAESGTGTDDDAFFLVDTTGGPVIGTLPDNPTVGLTLYFAINAGTSTLSIETDGSDTFLDGSDTITLSGVGTYTAVYYTGANLWAEMCCPPPSIADQRILGNISGGSAYAYALTPVQTADCIHTQSSNITASSTTDLSTATGIYVAITGTTSITAFTSQPAGVIRILAFTTALTLTHNATTFSLPGNVNITTADKDHAIFVSEGSGVWRCVSYFRQLAPPVSGTNTGDQTTFPWSGITGTPTTIDGYGITDYTSLGALGDATDGVIAFIQDGGTIAGATQTGSGATTTYTLTRDIHVGATLTIDSGVTVLWAGFRIFVKGEFINNGTLKADGGVGGNASSGTGGTAGAAGLPTTAITYGNGASGTSGNAGGAGASGNNAGTAGNPTVAGTGYGPVGGTGGTSTGHAVAAAGGLAQTAPAASVGSIHNLLQAIAPASLYSTTQWRLAGGAGGGGSGSVATSGGGGGGGGGGPGFIAARTITNNGTISSLGGNGGNGFAGAGQGAGGGAGSGGIVTRIYHTYTGSAISVAAGSVGTGAGGGTNGGAGNAGTVLTFVF